jgi:hypothetical protein
MIVVLSIVTDPPFQPECANCHSTAVQFWTNAEINPRREENSARSDAIDSSANFDIVLWGDYSCASIRQPAPSEFFWPLTANLLLAMCTFGSP